MKRNNRSRLIRFLVLGVSAVVLSIQPAYAGQPAKNTTAQHCTAKGPWNQVTHASWYGRQFQGRRTAGGTQFNPRQLTAAHRTLNIGTNVKVTELNSGRSVVVQITDRGPYLRGRGIDLSYAAARELGIVRRGVARVRIELLEPDDPATRLPIVVASNSPTTSWLPRAIVE